MDKRSTGVYVLVCCPAVNTLRRYIELEEFRDQPIDRFVDQRVSDFIEEILTATVNYDTSFDSMYDLLIDEILTFLKYYVNILGIKSIGSWSADTLIIHCSPAGVKHVNSSKTKRS